MSQTCRLPEKLAFVTFEQHNSGRFRLSIYFFSIFLHPNGIERPESGRCALSRNIRSIFSDSDRSSFYSGFWRTNPGAARCPDGPQVGRYREVAAVPLQHPGQPSPGQEPGERPSAARPVPTRSAGSARSAARHSMACLVIAKSGALPGHSYAPGISLTAATMTSRYVKRASGAARSASVVRSPRPEALADAAICATASACLRSMPVLSRSCAADRVSKVLAMRSSKSDHEL